MRNKDKNRLSILRAVLTDLSGRVKTSSHPLTQSSVLQVLSKHASQGEESAKSFDAAKRTDLAQKESEQVKVLHEYMLGIEKASEEEMDQVVHRLVWKDGVEQKPQMRNLRDSAVRILEVDKGKAIDMKLLMGIIKKYMVT
ncbi:MAG: hypothetical protein M4579_003756 [Chaenotheca gracillima]|nr:MAG: hypothetical protein M4579_003756 [Chaenotheca gracillima]